MSEPWIRRGPGELLYASDWNAVQQRFARELRDHDHTGGALGAPLGGASFDPTGALRVASLELAESITVGGVDVVKTLDGALSSRGGSVGGDLRVAGTLTVGGALRFTPPATGVFRAPIEARCVPEDKAEDRDANNLPLRYYKTLDQLPDGLIAAITLPAGAWLVRGNAVLGNRADLSGRYLYHVNTRVGLDRKDSRGRWLSLAGGTMSGPCARASAMLQADAPTDLRLTAYDREARFVLLEASLLAIPLGGA